MSSAKKILILPFLIAAIAIWNQAAAAETAEGVVKSSSLSKDSILIGDQTVWSINLEVAEGDSLLVLPYGQLVAADTTGAKIEPLSDFKIDTVSLKAGKRELNAKILITSFDSGLYKLPKPIFLLLSGNSVDTLQVEQPSLAVNTIQIDTAEYVIRDIKGNIKYPVTFKEIAIYLLTAIAVAVVIYLIIRYIKYRRENRDFFGRPIVQDPPYIVALRKLDKIRSEKLWQNGKEKQYYTGITDALREYIQKRYSVGAMEMTSAEILESLKEKEIEERVFGELDTLLKTADLVKFAKYIPDVAANEDAVPMAVRFVNSTFMQELEQEKEDK